MHLIFHDSYIAFVPHELASNPDGEGETAGGPRVPAANPKAGPIKG